MVFSSSIFLLGFLPIVFIVNKFLKVEYSNYWLLVASLLFYAWGEPYLVLLMLFSIVFNWFVGRTIGNIFKYKKAVLALGIIIDLLLLGYYKYAGFIIHIINSLAKREFLSQPKVALPIGISFFTFQAISYLIDVYRGETEPSNKLVNVALYISFFPQLIAGPIVKYRDINTQIESRKVDWTDVSEGFKRFIYGLAKKMLIANTLGLCVDTIYSYDVSLLDYKAAWICSLAYTLQIYYDFSGYSDMAIGLGRLFGFRIQENFLYPYMSGSISEFWRRWHISLGTWFREYVYIPLGGNRIGKRRTYINLIVVFFLTGLWHGADFSFIIWGMYHGLFSLVERVGLSKLLNRSRILSRIYCILVVNFGWVLFRAGNMNLGMLYWVRMMLPWKYMESGIQPWEYINSKTIIVGIMALFGVGIYKVFIPRCVAAKWKDSVGEAIYCIIILILSIASIASETYNPFIYFQF